MKLGDWIAYTGSLDGEPRIAQVKEIKPDYLFAESETVCLELNAKEIKDCRRAEIVEIQDALWSINS